jgi:endonuclease YncB( thermonuclease family)
MHIFKKLIIVLSFIFGCITLTNTADAQDSMRISRFMVPVDPVTLKSEGIEVRLWGVKPIEGGQTYLEIRALEQMKNMIGTDKVNCRIMSAKVVTAPTARCSTASGEDIGITLLQKGLVIRDRRVLYGSVFASSYEDAENSAKNAKNGVWATANKDTSGILGGLFETEQQALGAAFLLIAVLAGGLVFVFLMIAGLTKKLNKVQFETGHKTQKKEQELHKREKALLLAAIKKELEENKAKVEAFLTVYMEMLSDIKDEEKQPKYQQSGDVVAVQPNMMKAAYDLHIAKLSELDMQTGAMITAFYKTIEDNPEYLDLSATTPREEAARTVEQVVVNARTHLPEIDRVIDLIDSQLKAKE